MVATGRRDARGFTMIEMLVSLAVMSLATTAVAGLLIHNSRMNKAEQMTAAVQANARNTLEMIVSKLRSAGWDPMDVGIAVVTLDPDLSDGVSQIEVFADLNADGETDNSTTADDTGEQVLIRHTGTRVEWRPTSDTSEPFVVLATNITNDADGDGTPEPMFTPDAVPPTRIAVQITASSPVPHPVSGEFIRYTVRSDVTLRKNL